MAHHSPRGYARTDRVGEQIQRELAVLVRERVKDPRVTFITILDVDVSKDLSHAKVWFDVLNPEQGLPAQEALNHAAGFLRHELGKVMKLRVTPQLQFFYDDTQAKGDALDALINKAVASDRAADSEQPNERDE
mgnify:FL=1